MKKTFFLAAIAVAVMASMPAFAQTDYQEVEVNDPCPYEKFPSTKELLRGHGVGIDRVDDGGDDFACSLNEFGLFRVPALELFHEGVVIVHLVPLHTLSFPQITFVKNTSLSFC